MVKIHRIFLLLFLSASQLAVAQYGGYGSDYGSYGGGYGQQKKSLVDFHIYTGASIMASDVNSPEFSGSSGAKITGGVQVLRYLGFELSLADAGDFKHKQSGSQLGISQQVEFAALGIWPVSKAFKPFAKLGFTSWSGDFDENIIIGTDVIEDASGSDIFHGIGVKMGDENKGFILDFMRYTYSLDDLDEEIRTSTISFGFEARFL